VKPKELIGHKVHDSYRVTRLMDEGGMGVLYQALNEIPPRDSVVLKVFNPGVVQDATAYARARMEAEVVSALDHQHIAHILGFGELSGGQPYMVVEFLEGEGLGVRLEREGRLAPATVGRLMGQLGEALEAAHDQDIFHRDLKPGYVYLAGDPDRAEVKLLNFGISKIHDPRNPNRSSGPFGRAYFTSPEQLGKKRIKPDRATDIFSMGCVAYLALAGEVPFPARSMAKYVDRVASEPPAPMESHVPGAPKGTDSVLRRAMATDRKERYEAVDDFVGELMEVIERWPPEPDGDTPAGDGAPKASPDGPGALPRVVPPREPLPSKADLSRMVRPVSPTPAGQPFEDHATVLMDDDELQLVTPSAPSQQPAAPARQVHETGPMRQVLDAAPRPRRQTGPPQLHDASFIARKTAIAPPLEPDDDEDGEEEIVLRDVSETDEDGTTTNIMGVDELACEPDDEDVTDLIPLGELLKQADGEDEEETSTVIAIDLEDVEELSELDAASFKDTVTSAPARRRGDELVDADTVQYAESPRTEFEGGVQLRDVSEEVDEEAETEIHEKSRYKEED